MKLTKKEKQIVLRAAELIETYECFYSCVALDVAETEEYANNLIPTLSIKYADFYEQTYEYWDWTEFYEPHPDDFTKNLKNARVLMLLTFAHLG